MRKSLRSSPNLNKDVVTTIKRAGDSCTDQKLQTLETLD